MKTQHTAQSIETLIDNLLADGSPAEALARLEELKDLLDDAIESRLAGLRDDVANGKG